MKKELVIAALSSCIGSVALAADPAGSPQVPEGLLACSNIQDTAERVRCYDAQVAAMKKARNGAATGAAASSAVPAPAPGPTAAPTRPAAVPALPAARAPAKAKEANDGSEAATTGGSAAPDSARRGAAQPSTAPARSAAQFGEEELPATQRPKPRREHDTLSSSITGVTKGPPGIYYFSLANGQVWRAEGSQIAVLFRVGIPVRIERGALGSYHMSAPEAGTKNWMYVRRIR